MLPVIVAMLRNVAGRFAHSFLRSRATPAPARHSGGPMLRRKFARRLDFEELEALILPSSSPPVAVGDSYTMVHDRTLTEQPLINDSDPEGDTLTPAIVNGPSNGYAFFNTDNSLAYYPNGGFVGTDQVTYQINDGTSDSNTATITITVTNQDPSASDLGPLDVHQGSTLAGIDLLASSSERLSAGRWIP